jgi:hypothetical protein
MTVRRERHPLTVRSALFVRAAEGEHGHTHVQVAGEHFIPRAVPLVAQLGAQPIVRIVIRSDGKGFAGILEQPPRNGDRLKVGYADTELRETSVVYGADGPGPRVA